MRNIRLCLWVVSILLIPFSSAHADFLVGAWNLESGDSKPRYLAEQIQPLAKIAVWGFSEVQDREALDIMCQGLNQGNRAAHFQAVIGTTGRNDRLAIAFDSVLLDSGPPFEIHETNVGGTVRASLGLPLREKATGQVFFFVVNHFYRGKSPEEPRRNEQSRILREWAKLQKVPVIAVGDFNFDCDISSGVCNSAHEEILKDEVFKQLVAKEPIRTQCSKKFNSILDFIFVSGHAKGWASSSEILNRQKSACDDDSRKSDHRPIAAALHSSNGMCVEPGCN